MLYNASNFASLAEVVAQAVDGDSIPGALREGDIVTVFRPNGTFTDTLEVTAMSEDDARVIDVDVVAGGVGLAPGDRLIVKSARRPLVFLDPAATQSLGSTLSTDPEVGWARGYVREPTYDCVVGITGESLRLHPDGVGGFVMRIRK